VDFSGIIREVGATSSPLPRTFCLGVVCASATCPGMVLIIVLVLIFNRSVPEHLGTYFSAHGWLGLAGAKLL